MVAQAGFPSTGEPLVSDSLLSHQPPKSREGLSMTTQWDPEGRPTPTERIDRIAAGLSVLLCSKKVLPFSQKLTLLVVVGCYRSVDLSREGHGPGAGTGPLYSRAFWSASPLQSPGTLLACFPCASLLVTGNGRGNGQPLTCRYSGGGRVMRNRRGKRRAN